jgi:hypothetical protein
VNPRPDLLRDEARDEAYQYFDENIRKLPRKPNGTFDESDPIYVNSDVDTFRHAYVSAIFTQEYGSSVADIFGRLNELTSIFSPGASTGEKNMDLWNNSVGRKYGEKFKDKTRLREALRKALRTGEFITTLEDVRAYEGAVHYEIDPLKPIVVLDENTKGRNEIFYDVRQKKVINRTDLVVAITAGKYPGYSIRKINGIDTPVSKSDNQTLNNLC